MDAKHTPIVDQEGLENAMKRHGYAQWHIEGVVRAVNLHDDLVNALGHILAELKQIPEADLKHHEVKAIYWATNALAKAEQGEGR